MSSPPLIGCTTYRKTAQDPPIDVFALMPHYINAVRAAGGIPILIPLGLTENELNHIFNRIDGLLLPGGGDIDPAIYQGHMHATVSGIDVDRDRIEFHLVKRAYTEKKPLLAICRGHQVMNVALGGTLWEDVHSQMNDGLKHDYNDLDRTQRPHQVRIEASSHLARALGRDVSPVNSIHHQGIRQLSPKLIPTAWAPDGLIEAIEAPDHPFAVGVQWHPENLVTSDDAMLNLFKAFVTAATEYSQA
ncbi:MAG TPA: gamma-glutamyl-gamma-aminobutyrate hydrolase family protein [Anaerolineae bacterium]|nr:gamma-glutamyl-gamma-aminobutyrate hydrolase family protein [Anaerolineae bacterium]